MLMGCKQLRMLVGSIDDGLEAIGDGFGAIDDRWEDIDDGWEANLGTHT